MNRGEVIYKTVSTPTAETEKDIRYLWDNVNRSSYDFVSFPARRIDAKGNTEWYFELKIIDDEEAD